MLSFKMVNPRAVIPNKVWDLLLSQTIEKSRFLASLGMTTNYRNDD